VLDADGSMVAESRHLPYGAERWTSGTLPTDYRFTGQRHDPESGNYYYRARVYSPALGRFLSVDSLGFKAGDYNLYCYVSNNPLKHVDPSGHREECAISGVPCAGPPQPPPPPISDPFLIDLQRLYPDVQVMPNSDGTYTIYSLGNPPFVYPTEVKGVAYILRCEAMGEQARSEDPDVRETSSAAIVWIMRNMVEKGRCWGDRQLTTEGTCQSRTNPSKVCTTCKTVYRWYRETFGAFEKGNETYPEDESIALRVFLGQIPDPMNGAVYMINHQRWENLSQDVQEAESSSVTWPGCKKVYGHHFYRFQPPPVGE
jgi:RHS repeat-associated protein